MKKLLNAAELLLEFLAAVCLILFCCTTFLQVVLRSLGIPVVWAEEVARYSFIYMVFLGCTVGVKRAAHYTFDIFGKMKQPWISRTAQILTFLFELVFFIFLFYTSLLFVPQMHARASSILRIPMSFPYASIILFAGLSILFTAEQLFEYTRRFFGTRKEDGK